jgi:hypothetical protein
MNETKHKMSKSIQTTTTKTTTNEKEKTHIVDNEKERVAGESLIKSRTKRQIAIKRRREEEVACAANSRRQIKVIVKRSRSKLIRFGRLTAVTETRRSKTDCERLLNDPFCCSGPKSMSHPKGC